MRFITAPFLGIMFGEFVHHIGLALGLSLLAAVIWGVVWIWVWGE